MIIAKQTKTLQESKKLKVEGFEVVNVLSWHKRDSPYYELCPYALKTDGTTPVFNRPGVIFENYYQSLKVYQRVYDIKVKPNYMSKIIWWQYHSETHLIDDVIQPEYYLWRDSVQSCPNPLRYPNGFKHKSECKFTIDDSGVCRDYIESRCDLYCSEYMRLIKQIPSYHELIKKLKQGINLCITEVDLPTLEKPYPYNCVDSNGFYVADYDTLEEMLFSPVAPFGHGLCLIGSLLDDIQ